MKTPDARPAGPSRCWEPTMLMLNTAHGPAAAAAEDAAAEPAVAEWARAVRLLLEHRLYAAAVRVARLALAALPEEAAGVGKLHHLLAVALTETGQAHCAAAHYARALDELALDVPDATPASGLASRMSAAVDGPRPDRSAGAASVSAIAARPA